LEARLSFFGIHGGLLHFDNVGMLRTLIDIFQEFLKAGFIALCLAHHLEKVSPSRSCVLKPKETHVDVVHISYRTIGGILDESSQPVALSLLLRESSDDD
jgi:microsomal dipeptidase-like Zn-dependent dipeptidase